MTTVLFPLSAHPLTFGHLDVIERSATLFDKVVVAIGNNDKKKYLINQSERVLLCKKVLEGFDNVEVIGFDGLLVDFAYKNNFNLLVRGLRDVNNYHEEIENFNFGYSINNKIDTVFLPNKPDFPFISSSLVRENINNFIFCGDMIHPEVEKIMFFKIHNKLVLNVSNFDKLKIADLYLFNQRIKDIVIPADIDTISLNVILSKSFNSDFDIYLIDNQSQLELNTFQKITLDYSIGSENLIKHFYNLKENFILNNLK